MKKRIDQPTESTNSANAIKGILTLLDRSAATVANPNASTAERLAATTIVYAAAERIMTMLPISEPHDDPSLN